MSTQPTTVYERQLAAFTLIELLVVISIIAMLIAMLKRPEGASIAEIVAATGWLGHTSRGVISGVLKKRLGLAVTSIKEESRGQVYRLN